MTDELTRTTATPPLNDHWTRNVSTPLVPPAQPPVLPDESERILAERDARKGLHPPEVSLRRVR